MEKVSPADAGCWVDGHRGIYGVTDVIEIAETLGFELSDDDKQAVNDYNGAADWGMDDSTASEWVFDLSDRAESWLNDYVAPDGYWFGWHDGEFFLSSAEWWAEDAD